MRIPLLAVLSAAFAAAHPLGNFSANHYMKFEIGSDGIDMVYVLDLAEIPTFELMRDWGIAPGSSGAEMEQHAVVQARNWMEGLSFRVEGTQVRPVFKGASVVVADGAGNLPILRITTKMFLRSQPGRLQYQDDNYEGRAGWKEIVIQAPRGRLTSASQSDQDRSQALSAYPPDPMLAPPQDLHAEFVWIGDGYVAPAKRRPPAPLIRPIAQPAPNPAPPPSVAPRLAPAGTVVRNDFLSRMLRRGDLPLSLILASLAVAFGLGAAHALTPGHGKTIVAAYLVGSRGTLKHAAFLGAMVTFTHTVSVFALGLAALFLFRFVVPEKIVGWLGAISGLSIAFIGAGMLSKRLRTLRHTHAHHHHHHHHDHPHDHPHDHHYEHDHGHRNDGHHHGPDGHAHAHAHAIEGDITWGSLVTLAIGGGLVPCESALILLLSAIALGRAGLGLLLLISFSLGLAGVLMAIGAVVLYGKRMLPARARVNGSPWLRWVPLGSAGVVMILGLVVAGVSVGWLPARWLIG